METDFERYAWLVNYELQQAERASTPDEKRHHEQLARLFSLKLQELERRPDLIEKPPKSTT